MTTTAESFRLAGSLLLAATLAAAGCAPTVSTRIADSASARPHYSTDSTVIQIVSTKIGGKNLFIPATLVVESGVPYTLSIYNTTEVAHGFRIAGLGIETVLMPGEEHIVPLPPLEGERIYRVNCHLHEAHRSATLVVLPGE